MSNVAAAVQAQTTTGAGPKGPPETPPWVVTFTAAPAPIEKIAFRIVGPGVRAALEVMNPGVAAWEWAQLLDQPSSWVRFEGGGKVIAYGDSVEFEFATFPAGYGGWRNSVVVPRGACREALRQARDHARAGRCARL